MKSLIIEPTQYTPKIFFMPDGDLLISGKSLPEDTAKFYEPIIKWMEDCTIETIRFTVRMHYLNSSSANQLSKVLTVARDNVNIKNCTVDWYYEPEDEDNLEFGREMEYHTDFKFNYFEHASAM